MFMLTRYPEEDEVVWLMLYRCLLRYFSRPCWPCWPYEYQTQDFLFLHSCVIIFFENTIQHYRFVVNNMNNQIYTTERRKKTV